MYDESVSIRGIVDLSFKEMLDEAESFLTRQGHATTHRTRVSLTGRRQSGAPSRGGASPSVVTVRQWKDTLRVEIQSSDCEDVREQRDQWEEWSKSLPKKKTKGSRPGQRDKIVAVATGIDGQVELLQEKIRIRRQGSMEMPSEDDVEFPTDRISSVRIGEERGNDYIRFMLGKREGEADWSQGGPEHTVRFDYWRTESFKTMKRAVEQEITKRRRRTEAPAEAPANTPSKTPTAFVTTAASGSKTAATGSKVAGGAEILDRKLKKLAEQNMSEDESIKFCLVSTSKGPYQALVALEERLLAIKPGFAGTGFGARAASFYYRDIDSIEAEMGLAGVVIRIETSGRLEAEERGSREVIDCLSVPKSQFEEHKPYINRLRAMATEAG